MKVITLNTPQLEAAFLEAIEHGLTQAEEGYKVFDENFESAGEVFKSMAALLYNWATLCQMAGADEMEKDCIDLAGRYESLQT